MRRIHTLTTLIVLTILSISCTQKTTINISGKIGKDIKNITVSSPIDGNYFSQAVHIYDVNNGNFSLQINSIEDISLITISSKNMYIHMYVSPGEKYSVDMTGSKPIFSGKNHKGNMLINELGIFNDAKYYLDEIDNVKGGNAKLAYIKGKENEYKKMLDKLDDNNFKNIAYNQVKAYMETLLATSLYFEFRAVENSEEGISQFMQELMPIWDNLYKNINSKDYLLKTNMLLSFMGRYIGYIDIKESGHLVFETNHFNKTMPKMKLSGKLLEYTWAESILYGVSANLFEKSWITSFNEFNKEFPNNKLSKWIKPSIDNIITYHKNLEEKDSSIVFWDKKINTLEDLCENLKGKLSYIDLWATWCSPCREELQHSIKLHKQLEDIGVQTVYISIDNKKSEDKWREMVKSLPLKGINILASKKLNKDLSNKLKNFNGIPRYLIISKDGKLIDQDAIRPSSGQRLIKYLKEL